MNIRPADEGDIPAIAAIYAHHVRTGTATFETEAPDEAEMRRRFGVLREGGFPYIVAEVDGVIAGYAYAGPYRPRFAYRFSLEDSIYLDPKFAGKGLGRALLERLIVECEAFGCRQLIAVIGDSGNAASVGVHAALGFTHTGTLTNVGFKFGRWLDTVIMQRAVGPGSATLP